MKMKKVSLRELVADKIVYAVLLAMTYWLWARNDWKDYYTTIQYVIDVFAFFYFVSRSIRVKKYKQEEPDEMSEELARLIGGAQITETARRSAREMKKLAQDWKLKIA